ncbi:MAG: hypothetical protein M1817_005031 [Caeruleum heppii]|nr:MAG: hypothetical protein M1817_005031 [Caeruleum heppii]
MPANSKSLMSNYYFDGIPGRNGIPEDYYVKYDGSVRLSVNPKYRLCQICGVVALTGYDSDGEAVEGMPTDGPEEEDKDSGYEGGDEDDCCDHADGMDVDTDDDEDEVKPEDDADIKQEDSDDDVEIKEEDIDDDFSPEPRETPILPSVEDDIDVKREASSDVEIKQEEHTPPPFFIPSPPYESVTARHHSVEIKEETSSDVDILSEYTPADSDDLEGDYNFQHRDAVSPRAAPSSPVLTASPPLSSAASAFFPPDEATTDNGDAVTITQFWSREQIFQQPRRPDIDRLRRAFIRHEEFRTWQSPPQTAPLDFLLLPPPAIPQADSVPMEREGPQNRENRPPPTSAYDYPDPDIYGFGYESYEYESYDIVHHGTLHHPVRAVDLLTQEVQFPLVVAVGGEREVVERDGVQTRDGEGRFTPLRGRGAERTRDGREFSPRGVRAGYRAREERWG